MVTLTCLENRFLRRAIPQAVRSRSILAILFCVVIPAALLILGCSENPQEPVFANPFDPDTPGSSNPLNLRAVYYGGKVTLTWTALVGHGIKTYVITSILHGTPYELDRLEAVEGTMTYVVLDPSPGVVNAYQVRALDAYGRGAAVSHLVPAAVAIPPILSLASGQTEVRSRYQDLVVRTVPGHTVQVDTSRFFTGARSALVGNDSTAHILNFDLGLRPSATARCTVYAATVFELGDDKQALKTDVDMLILRIVFNPTINLPDTTFTVAAPEINLVVSDTVGVEGMLLASSAEGLADAVTRPAARLVPFTLLNTPLPQRVHARFLSEFGFSRTTTLDLSADNLNGAAFKLDLPPNRVTSNPTINIHCRAVATEMRISQYPDFRDAPWQPYAMTTQITLDGPPGLHQVFAWFRNNWFESAILTEHVVLAGAGPRVAFTNPTESQVVRGGTRLQLAGTSSTFDGSQSELTVQVKLDADVDWLPAEGTNPWSAFWDIPQVESDTVHPLGARAILAGDAPDTATTWINVTISQLRVAVTAPLDGARILWGDNLTIRGTAAPLLNGADLDSVVVSVLEESLTVLPPLSSWSVGWVVPPGDGTVTTTLTATVHAGFDSTSHQIDITLAPPKPLE